MGEGSGVAVSCGIGRRRGSTLALLWLWCRPAAAAPVEPLAWELPCAAGMALKSKKKKKAGELRLEEKEEGRQKERWAGGRNDVTAAQVELWVVTQGTFTVFFIPS